MSQKGTDDFLELVSTTTLYGAYANGNLRSDILRLRGVNGPVQYQQFETVTG